MKLVSWNVNSLRSAEESFLEFVDAQQPDIVMIQELRAHPNDLSFFLRFIPGYKGEFNYSGRPGYGGTAWYHKESLPVRDVKFTSGHAILDSEGRTILGQLGNLIIINLYTPNGNRSLERLDYKLKFYKTVNLFVRSLKNQGYSIIIGGDLNVAHTELDLFAPRDNENHSGFLPQERQWLDELLNVGFVDTFRLFEKGGGHYTWWHLGDPKRERNKGWRFDYFLVSADLSPRVNKSGILKEVFGSDHCPIFLELKAEVISKQSLSGWGLP